MGKKTIYYDYIRIYNQKIADEGKKVIEELADIDQRLETESKKVTIKRTYRLGNDKIRIQCLKKSGNLWEILLLRLRDEILPGIADSNGDYKIEVLEDGKYYCEATTILYDTKKSIMVFQRNRYGIQLSGLEILLNELCSTDNNKILLKPIIKSNKIGILKPEYTYTGLQISVDNLIENLDEGIEEKKNATIIENLIAFNKFKPNTITINIGYDRTKKKDDKLDSELVVDTINQMYGNIHVKKLKVDVKYNEDTRVETIDLLDDRIFDHNLFEYNKANPISHERIIESLKTLYPKKVKELNL